MIDTSLENFIRIHDHNVAELNGIEFGNHQIDRSIAQGQTVALGMIASSILALAAAVDRQTEVMRWDGDDPDDGEDGDPTGVTHLKVVSE